MTTGFGLTIPPDVTYPDQTVALLGSNWRAVNFGVGGQTLANMESDAATQIDRLYYPGGNRTKLVWWGGTNDLYFGASASTTLSRSSTYYGNRKAASWGLVEIGILPRTNSGTPGTFETDRQTIRTSKLASYTTATAYPLIWKNADGNYYIDIGGDATIGQAGQTTNTTYYLDLVHLTTAGYAIIADYVKKAIQLFP